LAVNLVCNLCAVAFHELAEGRGFEPLIPFDRQAQLAARTRELCEGEGAELDVVAGDQPLEDVLAVPLGRVPRPVEVRKKEFHLGDDLTELFVATRSERREPPEDLFGHQFHTVMMKLVMQCGSDVALPFFHLDLAAVDAAEHLVFPVLRPAIAQAAAAGEALTHCTLTDRDVVVFVLKRHRFSIG
jgi:hypothetical protein